MMNCNSVLMLTETAQVIAVLRPATMVTVKHVVVAVHVILVDRAVFSGVAVVVIVAVRMKLGRGTAMVPVVTVRAPHLLVSITAALNVGRPVPTLREAPALKPIDRLAVNTLANQNINNGMTVDNTAHRCIAVPGMVTTCLGRTADKDAG